VLIIAKSDYVISNTSRIYP